MVERDQRPRYFVETFGCRVNQADAEGIRARLSEGDLTPARSHEDADVVVLHSCTVTHRSDADIRKAVSRVERDNPKARVVVSGCYAQRDPDAVAALSGTGAVIGHASPSDVADLARSLVQSEPLPRAPGPLIVRRSLDKTEADDLPPVEPVAVVQDRTRPFLKIQDGCDAHCTYCVIPSVRGAARSAPPDRIIAAARRLIEQGYFEIVLAGVHLGTYGEHLRPRSDLAALVHGLLGLEGLGRLRLSCIEPMAFPMALADLAASEPRLAPHFHLPLQSGSDSVLKRMARPYRGDDFIAVLRALRQRVPRACLATDVIVGFPGETEADFEETLRVVRESTLDYVHVFSYSDRPGVPSTKLPAKLSPRTIKDRARRLIEQSSESFGRFLDRQLGAKLPALSLETPGEVLTQSALSDNYVKLSLSEPIPPNTEVLVEVTGRSGESMSGRVIEVIRPAPAIRAAVPRSSADTVGLEAR